MNDQRNTAAYALPTHHVLVMSECQHRMTEITGSLDATDVGFERVNRPTAMTARAGYQHYDAIIVDLDGARGQILASVAELRRLEAGRGQPSTPIIGISSNDDALADLDAVERGCTEVHRGSARSPVLSRMMDRLLFSFLQTA